MLAPHAVDIAVTISSLIASLCFTFAQPFDDIFSSSSQVVHWSAEIQTKVYNPRKDWLTDRPTNRSIKRVNSCSLTKLLFRILQNSRKNKWHHSIFSYIRQYFTIPWFAAFLSLLGYLTQIYQSCGTVSFLFNFFYFSIFLVSPCCKNK